MSEKITPAAIQAIMHRGVPLLGAWGVQVLEAADGRALLRLPYEAQLLRPGGVISGPAIMGLADGAMWCALLSLTEGRDESLTSTQTVSFLRRVPPRPLLAEARLLKRGRTLSYGEVLMRSEGGDDSILVHVTATWAAAPPNG